MKYSLQSLLFILAFLGAASSELHSQCNAPIINSFSPTSGFIGSTVTITGANFSTTPSDNVVFFGATKATVLSSTFSQIEVEVPVGTNTQLISVKNHCDKVAYSKTHFNPIFCEAPLNAMSFDATQFDLAVTYGAYNMIMADLDLDGKPEPISGSHLDGISIGRNNSTPGTFNFTALNIATPNRAARFLLACDYDADGKLDIVFSGQDGTYVLRNTSTGPGNFSFAGSVQIGADNVYQCGAGDFNGDGKIDVVAAATNGTMRFYRNTSTGPGVVTAANAGTKATLSGCRGIMVADADCDGKADVYMSSSTTNLGTIRNTTAVGATTFTFENVESWPTGGSGGTAPYRCAIADFDRDGAMDFCYL